jgi:hypothetical protein
MRIKNFKTFESEDSWEHENRVTFPCVITQDEEPLENCVAIHQSESGPHKLCVYGKGGDCKLEFSIPSSAYNVESNNPGNEQTVSIDPWSVWMRREENHDLVTDLSELVYDILNNEDDDHSPAHDEISIFLDMLDIDDLYPTSIDEIRPDCYCVKLNNGMEMEVKMSEDKKVFTKADMYECDSSKYPFISMQNTKNPNWKFFMDDDVITLHNRLTDVSKTPVLKTLIHSYFKKPQKKDEEILVNHYTKMLKDFPRVNIETPEEQKKIDSLDSEIIRFKNLVSKYIGSKTADELYHQSKLNYFNTKRKN